MEHPVEMLLIKEEIENLKEDRTENTVENTVEGTLFAVPFIEVKAEPKYFDQSEIDVNYSSQSIKYEDASPSCDEESGKKIIAIDNSHLDRAEDIQPAEPEETSDHEEELPVGPTVSSLVETRDATGSSGIVVQPKKRYRPSKKDIQDYPFTPEDKEMIVEFVKSHPTLYDKRDRQWSNPRRKVELWRELAANFTNCTFQQVRKYFEARRTDFGKIEKREHKSGSAARQRTVREEDVMNTWGFLGGHIAHEPTIASDRFSPVSSHRTDADDSSSPDMSGLSATSIQRRKRPKQKRPRTLTEGRRSSADTPELTEGLQTQLTQIMTSINTLMPQAQDNTHRDITVFVQYLTQRLEYVPRQYQKPFFEQVIKLCHSLEGPEEEDAPMKEAMARGGCSHWTPTRVEKGTQT